MANIKYGRNNGTYTIPITSDPYANLGAAIGTILGNNYYERGMAKGRGQADTKADDVINDFVNSGTPQPQNDEFTLQQMYNKMYNDNNGYTPYTMPGTPLGRRRSVPDDLYNQAVSSGAVTLDGNDLSNVNKLTSNVNAANNGITVGSVLPQDSSDYGLKKNNFNGQRDLKAEKLDYIAQKYSGASPNPDGDAITVNSVADKTNAKIADTDFSKLPTLLTVESVQSAIRKELRKSGRTSAQINQILEEITPTLQAKVQQANETKLQGLTSMLNKQINDGDLDNAAATYARISQISKPFAQALGNKLKLAQDNMTADQKFEYDVNSLMKRYGWDRQTASNFVQFGSVIDPKTAYDIGLARESPYSRGRSSGYSGYSGGNGSGGNGGGGNGGGITDAEIAKMEKHAKALEDMINNMPEDDPQLPLLRAELNLVQNGVLQARRMQLGLPEKITQGVPAQTGQPAQSTQDSAQQPAKQSQAPLSDAAEQQRQRDYNRNQAIQAANRANLWINPYNSSDIRPAGPYDRATEQQSNTFKDWYAHYGYLFEP